MELVVSDETLRDGEQQVGVNFSAGSKMLLAKEIIAAGVDHIDTMPAVSVEEETLVKKMAASLGGRVYAATMLGEKHVDHAASLGIKNVILFSSVSDRLLGLKGMTREESLDTAARVCKHAKKKGMRILFAGEDATRADMNYLTGFIGRIEKYIDGFLLCDTVGMLTPPMARSFVKTLAGKVSCDLGSHFHNDRGLANRNTVETVKSGANIISATFGGIGERAGNADVCNVLEQLKKEGIKSDKIDYDKLKDVRKLVYRLGGTRPAKPYSARAFWHESGIHVNALIKDPLSYNSFLPGKYGHRNRFFFGKFSGTASYRYLLGYERPEDHLVRIRDRIKELSQEQRKSYSEDQARKIIKSMKL